MIFRVFALLVLSTVAANAQYYNRYGYAYPGRGYYAGGGHYSEHYYHQRSGGYAPRYYGPSVSRYAPRGGYDFSWGGGNRAYLGGRGGGWGGEW